jgi:hypothetical protein
VEADRTQARINDLAQDCRIQVQIHDLAFLSKKSVHIVVHSEPRPPRLSLLVHMGSVMWMALQIMSVYAQVPLSRSSF